MPWVWVWWYNPLGAWKKHNTSLFRVWNFPRRVRIHYMPDYSLILGSIGSILLAACSLPQLVKTIRTRSASDFDWYFLWMWLFGDMSMLAYSLLCNNWLLVANYGTNLIPISVIIYFKFLQSSKTWYKIGISCKKGLTFYIFCKRSISKQARGASCHI